MKKGVACFSRLGICPSLVGALVLILMMDRELSMGRHVATEQLCISHLYRVPLQFYAPGLWTDRPCTSSFAPGPAHSIIHTNGPHRPALALNMQAGV